MEIQNLLSLATIALLGAFHHTPELIRRAVVRGYRAIAITDAPLSRY